MASEWSVIHAEMRTENKLKTKEDRKNKPYSKHDAVEHYRADFTIPLSWTHQEDRTSAHPSVLV